MMSARQNLYPHGRGRNIIARMAQEMARSVRIGRRNIEPEALDG